MVGRTYEIETLREIAAEDRSRFIVVYGRRRAGKTFLIREAFDYRFAFSHTGMENGSMADQLELFHGSLVDQGLDPSTEVPKKSPSSGFACGMRRRSRRHWESPVFQRAFVPGAARGVKAALRSIC